MNDKQRSKAIRQYRLLQERIFLSCGEEYEASIAKELSERLFRQYAFTDEELCEYEWSTMDRCRVVYKVYLEEIFTIIPYIADYIGVVVFFSGDIRHSVIFYGLKCDVCRAEYFCEVISQFIVRLSYHDRSEESRKIYRRGVVEAICTLIDRKCLNNERGKRKKAFLLSILLRQGCIFAENTKKEGSITPMNIEIFLEGKRDGEMLELYEGLNE